MKFKDYDVPKRNEYECCENCNEWDDKCEFCLFHGHNISKEDAIENWCSWYEEYLYGK